MKDWVKERVRPQDGHESAANDGRLLPLSLKGSQIQFNLQFFFNVKLKHDVNFWLIQHFAEQIKPVFSKSLPYSMCVW